MTPPGSPASYRRQTSRDENVFSRLTSSTVGQLEERPEAGVISACPSRGGRAPLICTHVAEGHAKAVLSVCATNDRLLSGSKGEAMAGSMGEVIGWKGEVVGGSKGEVKAGSKVEVIESEGEAIAGLKGEG